jgi:hypothetical protein
VWHAFHTAVCCVLGWSGKRYRRFREASNLKTMAWTSSKFQQRLSFLDYKINFFSIYPFLSIKHPKHFKYALTVSILQHVRFLVRT